MSSSPCSSGLTLPAVLAAAALLWLGVPCLDAKPADAGPPIRFVDATRQANLVVSSPTFGAVLADVDNDGDDDLVVSRHAQGPALYLNDSHGHFTDATTLLPRSGWDRHGIVVVDLDDDGDRDMVLACGGADGVGEGCRSFTFRSRLVDDGTLRFDDVSDVSRLEEQPQYRSRAFLPLASRDGAWVDLYLACIKREAFPNRYYRNLGDGSLRFEIDGSRGLDQELSSEGMDAFVDLDRDGDSDLLLIDSMRVKVFLAEGSGYRLAQPLDALRAVSLAVGDLDRDGLPDLYVGTSVPEPPADRLSNDDRRIHFVLVASQGDGRDEITFCSASDQIWFLLREKPGILADDPSDIFVGAEGAHPESRNFQPTPEAANGEPPRRGDGVYVWREPETGRWHLDWRHQCAGRRQLRGEVRAEGMADVQPADFETAPETTTTDALYHNLGGHLVRWPSAPDLSHDGATSACAIADLDDDGWPDVVGIRRRPAGWRNGDPFVLRNLGKGELRAETGHGLDTPDDDLGQADQLVVGDVDGDGRLDLFATNGWGIRPGDDGPYKLFLNDSPTATGFLVLDLVGTVSNRDAIGAEVELYEESGDGRRLLGYQEVGAGFNRSQSSRLLHFGLGSASGPLLVKVRWPAGGVSTHPVTPGRHRVVEPSGGQSPER